MKFSEKLNTYMEELYCSAKELGNLSGISGASFSRYRSGERVPDMGTKPFENLCSAIAEIAAQKNLPDITADSVKKSFLACEDFVAADKEVLRQNFNTLIATLNINLTRLSQHTNYDTSAIFRIRNFKKAWRFRAVCLSDRFVRFARTEHTCRNICRSRTHRMRSR